MDRHDREILSMGEIILACVVLGFSLGVMMINPLSLLLLPIGTMMFLHGMKGLGFR